MLTGQSKLDDGGPGKKPKGGFAGRENEPGARSSRWGRAGGATTAEP